ncbi:CDP-diacylglycerol---glycerol-3-phosphate 1-phosphatidyltransferase, partial [Synchytrium endobioticum]|uniref:CDP-diacylglycerol--glycerol-3-phosphate 3-phosphatidyltransferase n=1 Tax=Synchytrium endobioticum TaxID=286115 RepID=A0A507DF66_9FUNG
MIHFKPIFQTSEASPLPRHWPILGCNGDNVEVIQLPTQFHQALLDGIRRARRSITLASLFLGPAQHDIVDALRLALEETPTLHVHILIDALRGTRHTPSSLDLLDPLRVEFVHRCRLSFFESPAFSKSALKHVLGRKVNEVLGVHHMKCYLFDSDCILGGANLNTPYFENRQDRYILFRDAGGLCQYFYDLTDVLGHASHHIESASGVPRLDRRNTSTEVRKGLASFIARWSSKRIVAETDDTILVPAVQLGVSGFRQHEMMFQDLLNCLCTTTAANADGKGGKDGWRVVMTSPYFNFSSKDRQLIRGANKNGRAVFRIVTAAPENSEFVEDNAGRNVLPKAYTYLEYRFLKTYNTIKKTEQSEIVIEEYGRDGWTFHAKGIWCYAPGDAVPCCFTIGSSNFNKRSMMKDFEAQVTVLTGNTSLQRRVHENLEFLRSQAAPIDAETLKRKGRRPNFFIKLMTLACQDMF